MFLFNGNGTNGFKTATSRVIHDRIKKIGGDGGLIAIDKKGNIEMPLIPMGCIEPLGPKMNQLIAIY